MSKKYYLPGVDEINQLVETPASKERTESRRFWINTIISSVSAIAAIDFSVITGFLIISWLVK